LFLFTLELETARQIEEPWMVNRVEYITPPHHQRERQGERKGERESERARERFDCSTNTGLCWGYVIKDRG